MAYISIADQLNTSVPKNLHNFIKNHLDMQFKDVHCMLRLPIQDLGLDAGCNFAIANTLLSLISGLTALTCKNIDTRWVSKNRFLEFMYSYFPWPPEITDQEKNRRAKHLYDFFRNPLTHSLGIKIKGNFLVTISKDQSINEFRLQELEKGQSLYEDLSYEPIKLNGEDIQQINLNVENLYANVRKMLKSMLSNEKLANQISSNLSEIGIS